MNIRPADGCRRDAQKRVERADIRHRLLIEDDAAGFHENGGFHLGHDVFSLRGCWRDAALRRRPVGIEV
jgi:hypothetical protein